MYLTNENTILYRDAEKRAKIDAAWSFYDETNLEDIEVCENVQRGVSCDEVCKESCSPLRICRILQLLILQYTTY